MTEADSAAGGTDRPATPERRRYNRRTPVTEAGPPYYEAFNRIATAMEAMQHSVEQLVIHLDDRVSQASQSGPRAG